MVQTVQQPIVDLQRWFDTDVGQYALKWQQLKVDALVADVFGYRAIQVGFPKVDLLTNSTKVKEKTFLRLKSIKQSLFLKKTKK